VVEKKRKKAVDNTFAQIDPLKKKFNEVKH
jgi:hypothetical protein